MTPDELRRMDNDICIIYDKGIKPVKAKKFYYFKHSMAKKLKALEISHNDIGDIDRGEWRKYNPYNPYVEGEETQNPNSLDIDSLDDLFKDDDDMKLEDTPKDLDSIINHGIDSEAEAPILPQEDDDTYDLQKELEAKFDELFGPIDSNDDE